MRCSSARIVRMYSTRSTSTERWCWCSSILQQNQCRTELRKETCREGGTHLSARRQRQQALSPTANGRWDSDVLVCVQGPSMHWGRGRTSTEYLHGASSTSRLAQW